MFVRRRPLARAAVIGGGAYMMGKRRAELSAHQAQFDSEQDNRIGDVEQQSAAATRPASRQPASMSDQLGQLTELHQQGALTDEEFAAAKSRLIGS